MRPARELTWRQTLRRWWFPACLLAWVTRPYQDDCWNTSAGTHTAGCGRRWWRYGWAVYDHCQQDGKPVEKGEAHNAILARSLCEIVLNARVGDEEFTQVEKAKAEIEEMFSGFGQPLCAK
jgi:hypothetical protein